MADSDDVHISLPPAVFAGFIVAALFGGGGIYGLIGPQMDRQALTQCVDNSAIAIDVVAQHGRELQTLRELIYERTNDRYTGHQAREDWNSQDRRDAQQDRRLDHLEE